MWWLRLAQSVWIRRGSAVPVVPGTGTVIMVIAARLPSSHVSQSFGVCGRSVAAWSVPLQAWQRPFWSASSQRSVLLIGSGILRRRQASD